jgi:hypothetical protein
VHPVFLLKSEAFNLTARKREICSSLSKIKAMRNTRNQLELLKYSLGNVVKRDRGEYDLTEDTGEEIRHLKVNVHANFVVNCFDFICTSIMLCVALDTDKTSHRYSFTRACTSVLHAAFLLIPQVKFNA